MANEQAQRRVALHNWRKDGCPESCADDPTSAGRGTYEREAKRVIAGLTELGYTITRPRSKRARTDEQTGGGDEPR